MIPLRNIEQILAPPEKWEETLRQILQKWNNMEYLEDFSVLKFVTRKWIEVNDLSSGQYSVKQKYKL